MQTYWFELPLSGPVDLETASESLYSICDDGQLAGDERGGSILFSRKARTADGAVDTAIEDAQAAGLTVRGRPEEVETSIDRLRD